MFFFFFENFDNVYPHERAIHVRIFLLFVCFFFFLLLPSLSRAETEKVIPQYECGITISDGWVFL